MKIKDIITETIGETTDINREVEKIVGTVDFLEIVFQIAKQKYPKVPFEMSRDDMVSVDASDGENDTFSDDYEGFTVMGMTYSSDLGDEVGVLITNAYTGPYKVILLPAIKLATEKCLQLVPGATPKLWVGEDESGGAWSHIARKLGYAYEELN